MLLRGAGWGAGCGACGRGGGLVGRREWRGLGGGAGARRVCGVELRTGLGGGVLGGGGGGWTAGGELRSGSAGLAGSGGLEGEPGQLGVGRRVGGGGSETDGTVRGGCGGGSGVVVTAC
ncbi:unnamed protein product [Dicrocoelium dendriticum]|nr:unnamed protein product [Dicrocoelium dendriticum]